MHQRDLRIQRKVMGSNFAEPLTGGVFRSETLPGDWCVTESATLTKILTLPYPDSLSARSAQGSPHRNVGVGERHGRLSQWRTRSAAQGDIGRLISRGLSELGASGHVHRSWIRSEGAAARRSTQLGRQLIASSPACPPHSVGSGDGASTLGTTRRHRGECTASVLALCTRGGDRHGHQGEWSPRAR